MKYHDPFDGECEILIFPTLLLCALAVAFFVWLSGCGPASEPKPLDGCPCEGVADASDAHQKACDFCWGKCGKATSFREALFCSMDCTALCAGSEEQ